jgi:hypothetical protein
MDLETMVKRYIITTAQYNAGVNDKLLRSMDRYAEEMNAEMIVLPTTGLNIREEQLLDDKLAEYTTLTKDFSINKNLKIKDFGVRPQQINPLTGLERFAQGDKSYIMSGTKQVLKYIANSNDVTPKAIMTTGAITNPLYKTNFRTGRIAQHDHEYGFVVVEKENNTYFHFRHVTALKNGKFVDNGLLYDGKKKPQIIRPKALVVGDLHPYDLDKVHEKNTFDQIDTLNPENIFLHDVFNGKSISHHYKGRSSQARKAFDQQGLNLERELKETAKVLNKYASKTNANIYIVASNHDEHLNRYLDEGRFIGDKGNDVIGAKLYAAYLEGYNPLEYGLDMVGGVADNIHFLDREDDFKIAGFQLANHGDLGANGGRGSPRSIENANGKSITGHTHGAQKIRNTYKVGTSTKLRLDYNRGYSNWTQTNAALYSIGTVQLLNTIHKKWRM